MQHYLNEIFKKVNINFYITPPFMYEIGKLENISQVKNHFNFILKAYRHIDIGIIAI